MGFWSGLLVGLGIGVIGFIVSLLKVYSGSPNKEWEAYQEGYRDGINNIKKEKIGVNL